MNANIFTRRTVAVRLYALLTVVSLLLSAFPASVFVAEANNGNGAGVPPPQYTICHANEGEKEYNQQTHPLPSIISAGHFDHNKGGVDDRGDIIPPIPVVLPTGKNWDAFGQSIYYNDCVPPPTTGSITVAKIAGGDTTTEFSFTGGLSDFTLTGESDQSFNDLKPGEYTVTETDEPGWELMDISCSDGEGEVFGSSVTIDLAAGDDVTCTFTNRPKNPEPVACELVVKSDALDLVVEKNAHAKLLSTINGGWISAIPGSLAKWIWGDDPVAAPTTVDETQTFGKSFTWNGLTIDSAVLTIASDNSHAITLGTFSDGDAGEFNYGATKSYDVASGIVNGSNLLSVVVKNLGLAGSDPSSNPAGLLYELKITGTGATGNCGEVVPLEPEVPGADMEEIEMCKFDDGTAQPIAGWGMELTNGDVTYELVTGENGCVTQEVNPEDGPWSVHEEEKAGWEQEAVIAPYGVVLQGEGGYYCSFFGDFQVAAASCGDDLRCIQPEPAYVCNFVNTEDESTGNSCLLPSTLGDTEEFEIGTSGEVQLQTILNNAGYLLDVEEDQMNYQVWDLGTPSTATVTLSVRVLAKNAGNVQTFGYYEAGDTSSFVPVFVIPPTLVGDTFPVSVPASVANSMGFAIQTAGTQPNTWYSEKDLNTGDKDNVAAYNPEANKYVLAFEDLQSGDNDYNDLVVEISGVMCLVPEVPVLGCTDPEANNYDSEATMDDESCEYGFVSQCLSEAPNLLTNGSFEADQGLANGTWGIFANPLVSGWTSSLSDGLEIWRNMAQNAPSDGEQNAELDGNDATMIAQTIATVPGATYELSFDFAARSDASDAANNHIEAAVDGVSLVNESKSDTSWLKYGATFVADASTDVSFVDLGTAQASGGTGTLLDNTVLCLVSLPDEGDGDDTNSDPTDETVTRTSSGGGGGATSPVCSALTLEGGMLKWDTKLGKDLAITANGAEIFSTDDEDEVDAGSLYVGSGGGVEYILTVNRFSKSDTCTVSSFGAGGDFPLVGQVLGEQVSVVPYGGAAAGAGGTAPVEIPHAQTLSAIVLRNLLQVARNG